MFKNYLLVALRNMRRHTLYSVINLAGLTVALACVLLIGIFVQHELSFDDDWKNADRTYRISREFFPDGESTLELSLAGISPQIGPLLQQQFPEIEAMARMSHGSLLFATDEFAAYEEDFWVEPQFLQIFDLDWLAGDPATALNEPFTVVLTRTTALKFFGTTDAIGRTLQAGEHGPVRVTGVIEDLPDNTHFNFTLLGSFSSVPEILGAEQLETWSNNGFYTYIMLREGEDVSAIEQGAGSVFDRFMEAGASSGTSYSVTPVSDIHLYSDRQFEFKAPGSAAAVVTFLANALFILLMACINYMNLATARSAHRAREVGMRKAIGATRRQIILQFLGESIMLALIAVLLAALIVELSLAAFGSYLQTALEFDYISNPWLVLILLAFALITGVLGGSYPALYLSAFKPAPVLKGDVTRGRGAALFRRALVISQFAIAICLLICTSFVFLQMRYAHNMALGYDRMHTYVLSASPRTGLDRHWDVLRNELRAVPQVTAVTVSAQTPAGGQSLSATGIRYEGGRTSTSLPILSVSFGFLEAYGIDVVAGRSFSEEFATDVLSEGDGDRPSSGAYVLNEMAAAQLGWSPQEAVGRWIAFNQNYRGPVIGVVENAQFESVRSPMTPMVFYIGPAVDTEVSVKMSGTDLRATTEAVEATWQRVVGSLPLRARFVEEDYAGLYINEQRQFQVLAAFSLFAIFIACLGLFGLAAFETERRTKEIGVRKVMGGSSWSIVWLFSREFGRLVLLANLIAWPLAYLLMQRWLDAYAYRIDLNLMVFLLSGFLAALVAWVSVGGMAAKAANGRPVHALRYE